MKKEIPIFTGPESVKPAARGRVFDYEFEGQDKSAYIDWPQQYRRKFRPLLSPTDQHVLSDAEISQLLNSMRSGFHESEYETTDKFLEFLTLRNQVPERVYGMYENDVAVVRFFEDGNSSKKENILADIRRMNQEQGMGNVKIPNTNIEIINYSPCPKCGHVYSFADVFNYYMHPVRDMRFQTIEEQMVMDTRVVCEECGTAFLPALIISDGTPRCEYQHICRAQTIRNVAVEMKRTYQLDVMYMKNSNIITQIDTGYKAWRNDVPASKLKTFPGLFSNLLQYTPAPLMLDFISGKNLEKEEPIYGIWQKPELIRENW
jgi:uncharacterized OB-fold protein